MLEVLRKIGRFRIAALTAFAVVVPFLAYNFIYVSSQTGYYTERNFRILANFSGSVKERVEGLGAVSANAAQAAVTFSNIPGSSAADSSGILKDNYSANLKVLRTEGTNLTAADVRPVTPAEPSQDGAPARTSVALEDEGGDTWLYFGTEISAAGTSGAGDREARPGAWKSVAWRFESRTKVSDAISTIAVEQMSEVHKSSEHKNGFDVLLISELGGEARVIHQQSASGFILTSMNTLSSAADDSKKINVGELGKHTNSADVRFAGTSYKLFVQPIEVNVAVGREKKLTKLVACGLVQTNHFLRETWAIPPTILITFGFLTVLVALSWPFLKLLTVGSKDRVRSVDVYLLASSIFVTTSLLTFFLLYGYAYNHLDTEVDAQLKTLARNVQNNFTAEVQTALTELRRLNDTPQLEESHFREYQELCIDAKKDNGLGSAKKPEDIKNAENACDFAISSNKRSRILPDLLNSEVPHPYPYFNSVFWAAPDGQQALKWTVREQPSNPINVSFRPYFRDVVEGRLWSLNSSGFTLEPIISKTTGGNEAVIATPAAPSRPDWVSGINVRLLSVMQPVIPAGYGYAIIDESGTVLFHSDGIAHFRENFFVECDNNRLLRSAVLGHTEESINARYLGRGHRLYVQPIGPTSWALVTFNSKEYQRTSFSEILTLSLLLFLFYSLSLLLIFSLVYVYNLESNERSSWLWPDPRRAPTYLGSLLALTLLTAASFWLTSLGGLRAFILPASLSLLGLCLFVLLMKAHGPVNRLDPVLQKLGVRRLPDHRLVYTLNVMALFVLTGVVPAFSCFRLAYAEESRLLVKEGQVSLAKGLAEREARVRSHYTLGMFNGDEELMRRFLTERLAQKLDVYTGFFFNTAVSSDDDLHADFVGEGENKPVDFLKSYLPLFNWTSVERQAYVRASSADGVWRWERRDGGLVLHTKVGAQQDGKAGRIIHVASMIPGITYRLFWVAALPLLCLITFLMVRFTVRRIFLTRMSCRPAKNVRSILRLTGSQSMFLVMTPSCLEEGDGNDLPKHHVIDLQSYTGNGRGDDRALFGADDEIVIIENFGHQLDNPEVNAQRLALLEGLQRKNRRAIVLSSYDPEDYVFAAAGGGTEEPPPAGRLQPSAWRWVHLLSRFAKFTVTGGGNAALLDDSIEQAREGRLPEGSSAAKVARVGKVLDTIRRECSVSASLQRIGMRLAADEELRRADERWVIDKVLEQASVFYRALYDTCTDSERLTLFHLAKDRLVGPKDPDVGRLFERGLIVRDPDLKLMNDSFALYVVAKGKAEGMHKREAQTRESSLWESLKLPLGIVLTCIILFLFLTQRDLYNSTLAVVTAITAGIPSFFKLLDLLQRDAGGRASAGRTT